MKSSNIQLYLIMFCAWMCLFKSSIARFSSRWLFDIFHYLFIILFGFNSYNKTLVFWSIDKSLFFMQWFFWLPDPTLVPALNEHMLTDSDIWGIRLSKITYGFYAWSFQYGVWAISHHSNALFLPEVMALISSNLAMAFPSLIRNLISGSISKQSVGNYSKWFKTHFINGPVYP